jgi:hypothetical protein
MPRKTAVKASYSPSEIKQLMSETGSEKTLQQMVVKELERLGWQVLVTNAGIRKEAAAGLKKGKGAVFATPGIPDLFVRTLTRKWPIAAWIGIELKTATGKLSPAQQRLHDGGGSLVCRSLDDVLTALRIIAGETQHNQPNDYQSTNTNTDRNGQQLDECA